jgi:V-type H+-transporting ATPase proteolipid subunit
MSFSEPHLWTGIGAALSIFLTASGSAIASAEGGIYALGRSGYKAFIPIVQAGVLAIYGIIISILLVGKMETAELTPSQGYRNLSAGLSVGLGCWASGYGMAKFLKHCNANPADTMIPSSPESASEMTQPLVGGERPPVLQENTKSLILVMIFLESIGLYGMIVALFLIGK